MVTKVALCGATGKVGYKFLQYFSKAISKKVCLSLIIVKEKDYSYNQIAEEFKSLFSNLTVVTSEQKLEEFKNIFDVLLDFSSPSATVERAEECSRLGKPVVSGTTGFTTDDLYKLIEFAQTIPVIIAQNFCWGINFIFHLLKNAAKLIPENFFVEVYESHGPQKVDAPGGTAKRLIEILKDGKFFKNVYINNFSIPLSPQDLQVLVSRNSERVNQHTITIRGPFEEVAITHRAFSRWVYIEPALKTAIFSLSLKPGLYYFENISEQLNNIIL